MSWYLFPPKHQHQLSCVMHWTQNGAALTIGPFAELNFGIVATVSIDLTNLEKYLINHSIF